MTLSAALDASLAFGLLVVFFGVVYPGWEWGKWKWWGTEVYKQGCDWGGCTWNVLKKGEKFGPVVGSWFGERPGGGGGGVGPVIGGG